MKKQLLGILMWLVISAAFIGPGTVTTAAKAGSGFGYDLLWALVFSTLTCILLQEGAARASILSGKSLGGLVASRFGGKRGLYLAWMLLAGVVFGCGAYEAGNILGAISGLKLTFQIPAWIFTILIGILAAFLMLKGKVQQVARLLGLIVAIMGLGFLITALGTSHSVENLVQGSFSPKIPEGSLLLVLGLIGTTIVPYNLFLGSGISKSQDIRSMRWGVIIAVLIGGCISIAILLSSIGIEGEFSFQAMALRMESIFGPAGKFLFAFGLFAAGFTSAVTAPLASAVAVNSFLEDIDYPARQNKGFTIGIWLGVLAFGLIFGLLSIQPVPAIILAQAFNGLILPFVSILLWIILNDEKNLGSDLVNGHFLNICYFLVIVSSLLIGMLNLLKAGLALSNSASSPDGFLPVVLPLSLLISAIIYFKILSSKKNIRKDAV